jgi:ribosomal protein S18 acetylase RimI-like enzyme
MAAAVAAFDAEMFPYPHMPAPYEDNAEGYWAQQASNHPSNTEIITVAGRVAAMMHVTLQDSQKQIGRKYAELQAVAVAPEYRQRGIAIYLAGRAMRRAITEHNVIAFRIFGERGTSMINAAEAIGFTVSSPLPVWRKDSDGTMHAGEYLDLLVPQR